MELRPFQAQALQAFQRPLSHPSHVICIAPTGAGKSLIYEELALSGRYRMLLISPLVALARQQTQKLRHKKVQTALGSGGTSEKPSLQGPGVWIVSPESLQSFSKKQLLKKWGPTCLVVDECHCLWDWGENFRPAFAEIPNLLKNFQIQHSLWLTATLPLQARHQLKTYLPTQPIEIGSFALSSHLQLQIEYTNEGARAERLMQWAQQKSGFGLVFVPTRQSTERIARLLISMHHSVLCYHAGMSFEERRNVEQRIQGPHCPEIIIATSSFGMGMDHSHLQHVLLWSPPASLLGLVQAIGRAGRQKASTALILWNETDFQHQEWTLGNSTRNREALLAVKLFLESPHCRELGLKKYFNSATEPSCDGPCHRCDICLKNKE